MSYTPPGVETKVVIDSTIVSLPGGTRVLSVVGNADRTKSIEGEIETQTSARINQVSHSGLYAISQIYDYSGPANSLKTYQTSGNGAYGSGYYISGNNIVWTKASNSYPTSTTPAVSGNFFVTYSGTFGAVYNEAVTQNSERNITLASGVATSIIGVSGNSTIYPASGTVSGVDSLGFGIDESGYFLTASGTLSWNPVNPSAYSYPYATVPQVSTNYYVDYSYSKQLSDYSAKSFTNYSRVVGEYGTEATWTLITSGTSAGTYNIYSINPITLANKIGFQNGATVLMNVQNYGAGTTGADYLDSFTKLEAKTVDLIVPITIGSGLSGTDMDLSEKALALNYAKLHCETMSNSINKKERVALGSLGKAEIGDDTTPLTYIYVANSLGSKRISLVAPGTATVQLQDPSGIYQDVDVDGSLLAVAVAALSASTSNDVATPLTNMELTGFSSLSAETTNHPEKDYLAVEMNNLAAAGCMVITYEGAKIFVRHQLTTDQSNIVNGEFSVVTLCDYVSQAVRSSCEKFIGKKLKPVTTIPAVKGAILATLQSLANVDIISSIGSISVSINPDNATELLVEATYVPVFPLNRVKITFNIRTLG
jgi:hypothetical protein